jgi:MoaA/NifB/PqqE/SkfB family radical SAM enzyme
MGNPILIISGGEPLVRKDVFEIAQYGTDKGLRVVMATNGTLVTPEVAKKMKEVGIQRVSISGIDYIKKAGIGFQINTTITKRNIDEIPKILEFATELGAEALHIFLLVPTGRGKEIEADEIPPVEYERVLNWFYDQQASVQRKKALKYL